MDREKSVRRPFGFVSFSSEKSAEEVLRQQRHSVNGASIEVRPAKPRPHEQQQLQMQQQYQYGEYISPHHFNNVFISSISNATMPHPSMMNTPMNPNVYYTSNNNNYSIPVNEFSLKVLLHERFPLVRSINGLKEQIMVEHIGTRTMVIVGIIIITVRRDHNGQQVI